MGRPPRYGEAAILAGARHLAAELGPRRLTIAAVAKRVGAPVGSIYHRYSSRDEILAAVWLELVEDFQERFLAELEAADPVAAGLSAVRYVCRWIRRHPCEARLLLLHRREDFASDRWPTSYRRRAATLAGRAAASISGFASRLTGRAGEADIRIVRFAIVDLPTAALRREIEAGVAPRTAMQRLLLETCEHALRYAAHSRYKRRVRRT